MNTFRLFLLTLVPFPLLSYEFLPNNIIFLYTVLILLRVFYKIPSLILYPVIGYIIFLLKNTFLNFFLPEPMISFLALMCLTRILGVDKKEYKTNRLLGLLWIASFALFKTDILYLFFMTISLLINFKILRFKNNYKVKLNEILSVSNINIKELSISVLMIALLFFFFPRFSGFLPRSANTQKGQIGYSKSIDNSTQVELQNSSKIAFTAELPYKIDQEKLYWRGRVHTKTDGFNWRPENLMPSTSKIKLKKPIIYTIKFEQNLEGDIVLLDTPYKVTSSNLGITSDKETNRYFSYLKNRKATIQATSSLEGAQTNISRRNMDKYLEVPKFIPSAFKESIRSFSLSSENPTLSELILAFKMFVKKNKFSYSLNPGDVTSLAKFLTVKKGFCTHYAAFLGIVLRHYNFPTRLVSGFQGGKYNDLGGFYTVSSNDAHAWVEVYNNKKWSRIDPTSFVEPLRINLGGEDFFDADRVLSNSKIDSNSTLLYLKQMYSVFNYRLSLLIDDFDREKQQEIMDIFKVNKNTFLLIGFSALFLIIYILYRIENKTKIKLSPHDRYLNKFIKIYNKKYPKNKIFNTDSIVKISQKTNSNKGVSEFLMIYTQIKYNHQYSKENKQKLKSAYKKIMGNL